MILLIDYSFCVPGTLLLEQNIENSCMIIIKKFAHTLTSNTIIKPIRRSVTNINNTLVGFDYVLYIQEIQDFWSAHWIYRPPTHNPHDSGV